MPQTGIELLSLLESSRMLNLEKNSKINKMQFPRRNIREPLILCLEPSLESLCQTYSYYKQYYDKTRYNIIALNPNQQIKETKLQLKSTKRIDILLSIPSYLNYLLKDEVINLNKTHNVIVNSHTMITNSENRNDIINIIKDAGKDYKNFTDYPKVYKYIYDVIRIKDYFNYYSQLILLILLLLNYIINSYQI